MVGNQAFEHVKVWDYLRTTKPQCGFLKPHRWILDFVPLAQDMWNVKKKYSQGDNEFRQLSIYRPLFCPENYNNPEATSQLLKGGNHSLCILPDNKVVYRGVDKLPKAALALSMAGCWRIAVSNNFPVTKHFPNTTSGFHFKPRNCFHSSVNASHYDVTID